MLPPPVLEHYLSAILAPAFPAFVQVDDDRRPFQWGGDWHRYGVSGISSETPLEEQVEFLCGLIPHEGEPLVLPFVNYAAGRTVDVHIFRENANGARADGPLWVLLFDTTKQEQATQRLQQAANENILALQRRDRQMEQYLDEWLALIVRLDDPSFRDSRQQQHLTVLFADLRGFTNFTEENDPETVFNTLNTYIGIMLDAIHAERGIVDKIIGDEVMALFAFDEAAAAAVRAARRLLADMEARNAQRLQQNLPVLPCGIGLATGPVTLAIIGNAQRKALSVFGHHVNLAARLESAARAGEMLIDQDTWDALPEGEKSQFHPIELALKGIRQPVEAFACVA